MKTNKETNKHSITINTMIGLPEYSNMKIEITSECQTPIDATQAEVNEALQETIQTIRLEIGKVLIDTMELTSAAMKPKVEHSIPVHMKSRVKPNNMAVWCIRGALENGAVSQSGEAISNALSNGETLGKLKEQELVYEDADNGSH